MNAHLLFSMLMLTIPCCGYDSPACYAETIVQAETRAASILRHLCHPSANRVLVVAHRGDWRNAPENSLPAIQNCIAMGVDIVEIDVQRTKDGQYVLMHDKTLDRTTTGSGRVKDHTAQQLSKLFLENGYGMPTDHRIPTLQEALAITKDRILVYLDKSESRINEVIPIVRDCGMLDQVLFYGHRPPQLLEEELTCDLSEILYLPKIGDSTQNLDAYIEGFSKSLETRCFVVSFAEEDSQVLPLLPCLRQQGWNIWASPLWDEMTAGRTDDRAVNDPDSNWGWLIDQGANVLCTDRPQLLLEYLHDRGLHD